MPPSPLNLRRRPRVTREQFTNVLWNLAWTVLLTLLIWVYAEREQPANNTEIIFPLHVHSSDPSRLSTLLTPADGNVMVTLSGPKARLDDIRDKLAGGDFPKGLDIDIARPPGIYDPPAAPLLAAQTPFRDLIVKSVSPEVLRIRTENLIESTANVTLPPDFPPMEQFSPQPRTVRLRGPESEMRTLMQHYPDGIPVYPHLDKSSLTPGVPQSFSNVLLELPALPGIREPRTTLTPDHASAIALTPRRSDVTGILPSVLIQPTAPRTLEDEYRIVLPTDTLRDIRVHGPRDAIDRLEHPAPDATPDHPVTALLFYTRADTVTGGASRKPEFINLPPGVTIDDADKPTIDFKLLKRSAPTD